MVVHGRLLACIAGILCTLSLSAQYADTTFWVPNGKVESLVLHDTTVILGGDFDQVSPVTGSFARVDTITALPDGSLFKTNGAVHVICTDSMGRMYVGGSFTKVGGQAVDHLFRMTPDGQFDPTFTCSVDGPVYAMCFYNTVMYIGGDFDMVEGETRHNCASFRVDTFEINLFDPNVNGPVYCMAADTVNAHIVLGGDFTGIGIFGPPYIGKVWMISGNCVTFNAVPWTAVPNTDGPVYDVVIYGPRIYMAGEFSWFASTYRRGLAKISILLGNLQPENANVNGSVYDIEIRDSLVYIGGNFNSVGATPRQNLACVDLTFALEQWKPKANGTVRTLQFLSDSVQMFVGGDFILVNGDTCQRGALISANDTGVVANWNPKCNGTVLCANRDTLGRLYIGGDFFGMGGEMRNNLCAISVNTGRVTAWNPDVNALVRTMTIADDTLYFAGDFGSVGGNTRGRMAAIDLNTFAVTPFNPVVNGWVRTIAVTDSFVYCGGNFTMLGGQPRQNIGKVYKQNSLASPWNPGCLGTVNTILPTQHWVYVAGFYNTIAGVQRQNLARLHPHSGLADWNWVCDTDDGIYKADFYNGRMVLSGWFTDINGTAVNDFAFLDTTSLQVTVPDFACDGFVSTFTWYGDDFFLAGGFDIVNVMYKPNLVSYDESDDDVNAWVPFLNSAPESMQATSDRLYVGGAMNFCSGRFQPFFQVISIQWVTTIDETAEQPSFEVYPVPADEFITVSTAGRNDYTISDITGKTVQTGQLTGEGSNTIAVSGLAPGMYILTLCNEEGISSSQQIIKN